MTVAQTKAKELVEKFKMFNADDWEAAQYVKVACDEVMNNVVKHGAKWHEYNEVKNELLKM